MRSALFGIGKRGAWVLSGVSLLVWVGDVALSDDHHPLNFWLVMALAFLLVSVALWGWDQHKRADAPSDGGIVITGPTTVMMGGGSEREIRAAAAAAAPAAATISERHLEGKPDDYLVVNIWDLLEPVPGLPLSVIHRTFRYVELRGPALVAIVDYIDFTHSAFAVADGDIESIIWPMEVGKEKLGPIAMQACVFENCRFESLGFTGHPDTLERLRQGVAAP